MFDIVWLELVESFSKLHIANPLPSLRAASSAGMSSLQILSVCEALPSADTQLYSNAHWH